MNPIVVINKTEDVKKTKDVLTFVNPEVKLTDLDSSKIQRIGNKKGRTTPRPVKVVLDSVETKMLFIRNSKKLKSRKIRMINRKHQISRS